MKRMPFLTIAVLVCGIIMLLGSSYSLIMKGNITKESYHFDVALLDVDFQDNAKIALKGVPTYDNDGIKNSEEFVFVVNNNSDFAVNYRLDILETGYYQMSDMIRYTYSINDSDYSNIYNLSDKTALNQNKVLLKGESDVYKLKMWLSIDADELYMNKTFNAIINLVATSNEYKYATDVIEYLGENNLDGIQKKNNTYRYIDDNSLNYVWFNCQDNYQKGEDYCEKWRIIGSDLNNNQKSGDTFASLKIVRNDVYRDIAFNTDELNGNYNVSYINNYANGFYYDKLNNGAKELIMKSPFYIGSVSKSDYENVLMEELKEKYYTNVGLLNVSDYLLLENNSWFKLDNIVLMNKNGDDVLVITDKIEKKTNNLEYGFLPVVYLRADVSFVSGDGSFKDPYELAIKYPLSY